MPTKWEICECCNGNGRMENPAFSDGISGEEWANEWEQDEREAYLSGAYDVRCDECEGTGKVKAPVLSSLNSEDRENYEQYLEDKYQCERESAAERRWGF